MPEPDRHSLHRDLTKMVAESGLMGYGHVMDLAGCRAVVPEVLKDFPDMPYYDCFLKTVIKLSNLPGISFREIKSSLCSTGARKHNITPVSCISGLRLTSQTTLGKVSFASRVEPGIQAADLWVRELMKRCDTHLFDDRAHARPQWNTLMCTKRFQFHFTLGRELSQALDATPFLAGLNHADYERWRAENKLIDNLSNRFRYASLMAGAGGRS